MRVLFQRSYEGNTAAHYAVVNNNCEVLSLLQLKRALMNIRNCDGKCAIDYASDSTIERIIIAGCCSPARLTPSDRSCASLTAAPSVLRKPFQLGSKALQTLFFLGVSVMNKLITEKRICDVAMIPIDPPASITLGAALHSRADASPAVKMFLKYAVRMLTKSAV